MLLGSNNTAQIPQPGVGVRQMQSVDLQWSGAMVSGSGPMESITAHFMHTHLGIQLLCISMQLPDTLYLPSTILVALLTRM